MTTNRDFDRITRAWLDLMPDEAPDRTIAAVLQAIETSPQVRTPWRWLPWRPSPMNRTPIAIGAAIVATVAVVGALFLFRPASQPDVGSSSSPPPSSSPSAAAADPLPAELRLRWMGGERSVAGIYPAAGTILNFTEESNFFITQSNQNEDHLLNSVASRVDESQFRLESAANDGHCLKADSGLYSWSLSPRGRILTVTGDGDDCSERLTAVPGVWWLEDCKNTDTNCLGDLEAGTYKSQYIAPRVDPGAEWQPDFGALTYTVPGGWAQVDDFPETFGLMPSSDYAGWPANDNDVSSLFVFAQPRALSQDTPCSGDVDPSVERTVGGLVGWLRELPGLVVADAASITVDGRLGTAVDLRIDPSWTTACGGGTTPEILYMTPEVGIFGLEARTRLIFVDLGDGDVLGIGIAAPTDRFDAFVADSLPIIESFTLE
jgi:hypothetical protein